MYRIDPQVNISVVSMQTAALFQGINQVVSSGSALEIVMGWGSCLMSLANRSRASFIRSVGSTPYFFNVVAILVSALRVLARLSLPNRN